MAKPAEGTLLSCGHDGCGCRVRVESSCDCPGAGAPYVCTCGAPMVEVGEQEQGAAAAG